MPNASQSSKIVVDRGVGELERKKMKPARVRVYKGMR
jgi:hypothetical protein